jgi:hypothetical protein
MRGKRLRLILGGAFGLLLLFALFSVFRLPGLLTGYLTERLPLRVAQPAYWSGFLQVTVNGIELPHPAGGGRPPVISIQSATVKVPWWGILIRPTPVELSLESPRVILDVELGDSLLQQVDFLPMGGASQIDPRDFPVVPVGLKIREGRIEVLDKEVRPDAPLYIMDHLRVDLGMTSPLKYPSIHLDAAARFVTKEGLPVGSLSARARAGATPKRMEGKLEIWYDRLEDFRWVYQDSPEPFTFEGGAGGPVIRWDYQEGWLKASMQCRAKNLRIGGTIGGDLPWQQVLDTLADQNGEIDLTVTTEGAWGEAGFDVHSRLLSELDWAMRERAAAKGVRVQGRIFYGLLI